MRRALLLLTVLPVVFITLACDRDNLSDGPKLTANSKSGSGNDPDPDPDPGTGDCPTPPAVGSLKVKINEIMPLNTATLPDEKGKFAPWIELYNNSDSEMDLRGVPLSDELTKPTKWSIPCVAGAILPARGFLVIFADGDAASDKDFHASFTLTPKAGLQLMLNKGSDLFFTDASKLGEDQSAGRFPDGGAAISLLAEPTPGEANSEPLQPPPPSTEGKFVRGDVTGDGKTNIADMTALLKVLFQSAPAPRCVDSMDSNDDGVVNLTDALFIGQALFQRGPTFPPPYPLPAVDPTADALACPAQP